MKYSLSIAVLITTSSCTYGMGDKMSKLEDKLNNCIADCTTEYFGDAKHEHSDKNEPATLKKADYCVKTCTTIYRGRVKAQLHAENQPEPRPRFSFRTKD